MEVQATSTVVSPALISAYLSVVKYASPSVTLVPAGIAIAPVCASESVKRIVTVAGLAAVLSMPLSAARLSRKAPNAYLRRFCFPALSTYIYIW